jgi:hypothetical protein
MEALKFVRIKVLLLFLAIGLAACGGKSSVKERASFTKIDSLTENYLTLQDSVLQTWNTIMMDENKKINSMHELLHVLFASHRHDKAQLILLEQRLDQLERIRFNQKTMANPHVVDEYDFASSSLIFEIISLAESDSLFGENKELQHWVDNIKIADQRVTIYRSDYDSVTNKFNLFLEKYKDYLTNLDRDLSQEKKPLFQMAEN